MQRAMQCREQARTRPQIHRHFCLFDVARVVFGHDRYKQRVIDAVPMEWTEVQTNFGPRYVRRMITVTQTGKERHHVECRHQEV